jgi:glycosyltransferase involved in cell wall biosynthesis
MKIAIIIPAFNEEKSISTIISRIPQTIEGINPRIIVINDGSTDNTKKNAENAGALVISHNRNIGLGASLRTGLKEAISLKADVIVQIDADGQYCPEEIPNLIQPILQNQADLVLGTRFEKIAYNMPVFNKTGNQFVTFVVRHLCGLKISDAQTGFRAISKRLAEILQIKLQGDYTYTQEMIIHACFNNFKISEIPIMFNKRLDGKSRLIQNIFTYFWKIMKIIFQTFHEYKPLRFYSIIGSLIFILGVVLLFVDNYISLQGVHLIPPLNLSHDPKTLLTIFMPLAVGFNLFMFGIVLEMQKRSRNDIFQMQQQIKALLEEKLKDVHDSE